jgi:hypothetical protein
VRRPEDLFTAGRAGTARKEESDNILERQKLTKGIPPVVEISQQLDLYGVQVTIVTVPGIVPACHHRGYVHLIKLSLLKINIRRNSLKRD